MNSVLPLLRINTAAVTWDLIRPYVALRESRLGSWGCSLTVVGQDCLKKKFFLLSALLPTRYSLQLLGALQKEFLLPKHGLYCILHSQPTLTSLFPSTCCDLQSCLCLGCYKKIGFEASNMLLLVSSQGTCLHGFGVFSTVWMSKKTLPADSVKHTWCNTHSTPTFRSTPVALHSLLM